MRYVTLVDGVGRPKLIPLPDDGPLPSFIGYAHEGIKSGPNRLVKFEYCNDVDLDGRAIFRLKDAGVPAIRYAYLKLSPIQS